MIAHDVAAAAAEAHDAIFVELKSRLALPDSADEALVTARDAAALVTARAVDLLTAEGAPTESVRGDDTLRTRGCSAAPASVDETARTVRFTVCSPENDAVVEMPGVGRVVERLSLRGTDPQALIGKPLINGHRHMNVDGVIGSVIAAGLDDGGIWADVKFSQRGEPYFRDVAEGHIRSCSLGYKVNQWSRGRTADGKPMMIAEQWTPQEVSLVPVPVDAGARVRGVMMNYDNTAAPADETVRNRADYCRSIRGVAAAAGLPPQWADERIDAGVDLALAKAEAFESLARTRSAGVPRSVSDDPRMRIRGMSDALARRIAPSVPETEAGRQFENWSLTDMLGETLRMRGEIFDFRNRHAVADMLFRGAHSSSDFPLLLADAANKSILPAYTAASPTYRKWAAQRPFTDFKSHKFLRVGDFPSLTEITAEGGEIKFGTLSEGRETVTAKEYGSAVRIGRTALINDDLSALSSLPTLAGVRAAQDENALAYALLGSNPTMADGVALFHANHGNLMSGSTLDVTNVGLAIKALRDMQSLDGVNLNIQPKYLIVGTAREQLARQLLTTITPAQTSNVNPWSSMFELIVDAGVAGNKWYVAADPAVVPSVVYGYVAGQNGPSIRSEIDFQSRCLNVIVNLDYGVGAIDHRGIIYNPGN